METWNFFFSVDKVVGVLGGQVFFADTVGKHFWTGRLHVNTGPGSLGHVVDGPGSLVSPSVRHIVQTAVFFFRRSAKLLQ